MKVKLIFVGIVVYIILTFLLVCGCYASQIADPTTVPVVVTVDSSILCSEVGYCGDSESIVIKE